MAHNSAWYHLRAEEARTVRDCMKDESVRATLAHAAFEWDWMGDQMEIQERLEDRELIGARILVFKKLVTG